MGGDLHAAAGAERSSSPGFRARLLAREPLLGTFVQLGDATLVEVLARTGYDFGILDLEHGGLSTDAILPMVRAGDISRFPLLVRLPVSKLALTDQLLDSGVSGILVARVGTVADAEAAVRAVRYPPAGDRGSCPGTRANEFGALDWPAHIARAAREVVLGVALEGAEGLAHAEAIFAVPGIDLVFVGVFDLAASIGLPGRTDDPRVIEAVGRVAASSARCGLACGTWAPTIDAASTWRAIGVTFLPVSTDLRMWRQMCAETTAAWRQAQRVPDAAGARP